MKIIYTEDLEPGFYWYKDRHSNGWCILQVTKYDCFWFFDSDDSDSSYDLGDEGELGPKITPPPDK